MEIGAATPTVAPPSMEVEEVVLEVEAVVSEVEEDLEVLLIAVYLIVALSATAEVAWELERSATADQSLRAVGAATGADTQLTAMEWVRWVPVGEEAEAALATMVDTQASSKATVTAVGCLATGWEGTEVG